MPALAGVVRMFLDIRELEQNPIRFEQTLPQGAIRFDSDIVQLTPIRVSGLADYRSATEEIRVQGRIQVAVQLECDRCLDPLREEIDQQFDLTYVPDSQERAGSEIEIKEGDSNIGFYKGPGLELNDILSEQIYLALPMQHLCRPDCQGICPVCGKNRNEIVCQCQTTLVDDRWSALRDIKAR